MTPKNQNKCYYVVLQMMEAIVYGVANINFQHNLVEFRDENRTPNNIPMASPAEIFPLSHDAAANAYSVSDGSCPSDTFVDDNSWEETDNDESDGSARSNDSPLNKGLTFSERRQLPSRITKEKLLGGTKRRTIMKPTKRISSVHKDFTSLTPAEVRKIYTNKRLTKFRPSSLETIIEESPTSQSNADEEDQNEQVRFLGTRKYRRAVTFNDCFFANKALIKKRRAKIRKVIGRRPALKKISLEDFMNKLNSSMEDNQTITTPEDMDEGYCHTDTPISNIQDSINSSSASAHVGVVTEAPLELPSAAKHDVL